jgi:hypothetical protein
LATPRSFAWKYFLCTTIKLPTLALLCKLAINTAQSPSTIKKPHHQYIPNSIHQKLYEKLLKQRDTKDSLHMGLSVTEVALKSRAPARLPGQGNLSNVHGCNSKQRRAVLDHGILSQAKLYQEPGDHLDLGRHSLLLLVTSESL